MVFDRICLKKGELVVTDAVTELDMIVTSSQGCKVSLKRLQANETSIFLWVWVAHNGNKDTILRE